MKKPHLILAALTGSLLFTACLPAPMAFDPASIPAADDLGARNSGTEWWYVSGVLPDSGLAFHWAQFKVNYRGLPYHASHIAVTDLRNNKLYFVENGDQSATFGFPPLSLSQGDWKLVQAAGGGNGKGAPFKLTAGPLDLTLTPAKNAVVHPPGYSGTPETGRMYYQSVTRLDVGGTIQVGTETRPASGQVWLDHQWGDQQPGSAARWDWFGLHLSDGSDLMLYRVKNAKNEVVQVAASHVSAEGVAREVKDVTMTPGRVWTSPSGREYTLGWQVTGENLALDLTPLRDDQELLSKTTSVAYWEGPVRGTGMLAGQAITASGMGEFVGGVLKKEEGGAFTIPLR
ncbi:lipocalin family protein [Deinococcus arenicola]|uniref:Carotenoid 1,2-hydratase n=1 Tax=Deinococcus arenicola TaxID=2994950 RepID=A0ABU4DND9_9DEIO|nr:lipocalin family protein [Deinococcus sp. ZS9-10]MDV6373953.1 carotenoid 1,2-hydratase [Deinococcus sp. ZS9-10]